MNQPLGVQARKELVSAPDINTGEKGVLWAAHHYRTLCAECETASAWTFPCLGPRGGAKHIGGCGLVEARAGTVSHSVHRSCIDVRLIGPFLSPVLIYFRSCI